MAQPPVTGQFWSPDQCAQDEVLTVKDNIDSSYEDITWLPWKAICSMYFPQTARTPGGVKYLVRREAYQGIPPAELSAPKPYLVVLQLTKPQPGPDGFLRTSKRDILWVECKAPANDQPAIWKAILDQAATRLSQVHPTRNVWLIVASGLEWMVFYWDPSAVRAQPLQVQSANRQALWTLDPRINIAPLAGQRHIDQDGITIHAEQANSLDFWTMAPPVQGHAPQPRNLRSCLEFLEQVFQAIRTSVYSQANPPERS